MKLHDLTKNLNFFRYHLFFFTLTPLLLSGIFYAVSSGEPSPATAGVGTRKVEYIDALFLCFSAMTTTGLVTINVSILQPFQQVLLFILFIMGDFGFVSFIMVLIRKRFFRKHCEKLLRRNDVFKRSKTKTILQRALTFSSQQPSRNAYAGQAISGPVDVKPVGNVVMERMTDSPVNLQASGNRSASVEEGRECDQGIMPSSSTTAHSSSILKEHEEGLEGSPIRILKNGMLPVDTSVNRERTVQIVSTATPKVYSARQRIRAQSRSMTSAVTSPVADGQNSGVFSPQMTIHPGSASHIPSPTDRKHIGMGGFPISIYLVGSMIPQSAQSQLRNRLSRRERRHTLLLNRSETMNPIDIEAAGDSRKDSWDELKVTIANWMPEKLGGLVIGRNSRFFSEELDDEELEQLGGVEYRALRLLSYLVPAYILFFELIPFAIISIYLSRTSRLDWIFQSSPGVQQKGVNATWSALFLVVSAFTGCGMSLLDQSLLTLSASYLIVFALVVVLLAGNHALPMMLRFSIWLGTKIWRKGEMNETLHFLLDHPRRCFLYLFPSHQTWYLVFVLVAFILVGLFAFLVLNLDLPVLTQLNGLQIFADALLQSLSVRATGFGIVPITNMAPSVLFCYVILMYVAIYPIAMSVRSTNVYEEQALGVYEAEEDPESSSESEPTFQGKRHEIFSKYLAWHLRRQLAFDIWPLAAAIFLICVIERGQLMDPAKTAWFTVFRIIFECTSAYATIGLSLGTPNNNYSFTGEYSTLSKLIMILVMLRGRHRGLPVAIDRAILLPHAYARFDQQGNAEDKDNAFDSAKLVFESVKTKVEKVA